MRDKPELGGLTVNEAAKLVGVHPRSIMNWIGRGVGGIKLRAWKVGRCWRTSEAALAEFQAGCTPQPIEVETRKERLTRDAWVKEGLRRHNI